MVETGIELVEAPVKLGGAIPVLRSRGVRARALLARDEDLGDRSDDDGEKGDAFEHHEGGDEPA